MSVKMRNFTLFSSALAALILLAATFSACESTLGFGETIDWEPPVLKLDSNRNPRYVYDNAQLKGTVTDNIAIGRVELRYAIPDPDTLIQIKLGEAVLSGGNSRSKSWTIDLTREIFEEWAELLGYDKIDGAKIPVEIVAYDTSERSGDTSIRAISLIIDMTPPVVENTWITRTLSTPMRIFYLGSTEEDSEEQSLGDLKNLEDTDPRGEVSGNADKYQNGWFYIDSQLTEEETKIEEVRLQIYDTRYDKPLFLEGEYVDEDGITQYRGIERDKKAGNVFGTPVTAPRWLIKEEALIAAGEANGFPNYRTNYYNNGERYYYEVVISALDMSGNVGRWKNADDLFFVMWEKGDVPKGYLDLVVGGTDDEDSDTGKVTRTKGDLLPVEFFDDDTLSWAYTDLFTLDQWRGFKEGGNYEDGPAVYLHPTDTTLRMPKGTDDQKLAWLKTKLVDENVKTILNWKNDKDGYDPTDPKSIVTELLGGKTSDEKTPFIQTGTKPGDYGDYVLFTLVGDKKLAPHDPAYSGALNTLKNRWSSSKWDILLVDDNKPMIVFDTVNKPGKPGSPEENTFPLLDEGRYFTIHGYTLRQCNIGEPNKVGTLRMAWIPYLGTPGAQSGLVPEVLKDLETLAGFTPGVQTADETKGAQYWELTLTDHPDTHDPVYENIGGVRYRVQYFTKTFDVLGGTAANETTGLTLADYTIPSGIGKTLKNPPSDPAKVNEAQFIYNGKLENETKLFVFVAIDETRQDNVVNKQLPILGRKTPPKLSVYDISDREITTDNALSPPDIYTFVGSSGIIDNAAREAYQAELKDYNEDPDTFAKMSAIANSGSEPLEEALSLQIYPRGKTLLYWVQAEEAGDLLIKDIVMEDTTSNTAAILGNYVATAKRLSFVETLPEVTQRVFLFTATDTLGNERQLQRTVTITSTAMLTDISTPKPNGTYGISVNTNNTVAPDQDDRITIYARFSNRIVWEGTNPPLLNVRYQNPAGTYVIRQIPTITPANTAQNATLSLEFRFSIPQGAAGTLQTMYDSSTMTGTPPTPQVGDINRPITLPTGTRIVDVSREGERVSAFIPGYAFDGNKMETWRTDKNSLQQKKDIQLDGVRPSLIVVSSGAYLPVSGKAAFTGVGVTGTPYYFKSNETITFTLKASKRIQPSGGGNPRIQFYIQGATGNPTGPYYANYERANGIDGMIFTFPLSPSVSPPYANSNNFSVTDGTVVTNHATDTYNVRLNTALGGIEDIVGNALSDSVNDNGVVQQTSLIPRTGSPLSPFPANTTVYIDQTPPPAPSTVLTPTPPATGTAFTFSGTSPNASYNINHTLTISDLAAGNGELWPTTLTKSYSLNGGLEWTAYTAGVSLVNGTHNIVTRYIDRAGNEGAPSSKNVVINVIFPKLLGINSTEPNGTYNRGKSLHFNLDFAEDVSISNAANISLTLADTTNTTNNADGTAPSYQIVLSGTGVVTSANSRTITFTWNNVNGKDMLAGLKVTALNLSGLQDSYGNLGPAAANINTATAGTVGMPASGSQAAYNVTYDLTEIIVSGILPAARTWEPQNAQGRSGNITVFDPTITDNPTDVATGSISADNKRIRIVFSKPMQRGQGTITIRPHGNYAIPAVFENEGYYLTVTYSGTTHTETRSSAKPAGDSTYVSGMNDVYNNMTEAQRNTLITSGTLADPALNASTGLSTGPYKKMTHGLKEGSGYTGNYTNNMAGNAAIPNAPSPSQANSMIPDTTTKWVLDYQYQIHDTAAGTVTNIRNALTAIGFRRQDIAVTSTANVAFSNNNQTVTITLPEPLLPGLQWDLSYDAGTFTDLAGNPAPAVPAAANNPYWFWSKGVQKPVIRVDRKSYDGRAAATVTGNNNSFIHTGTNVTQTYAANGYAGAIGDFNTVAYRIETETPGGRIYYMARTATDNTDSATAAWTGQVPAAGYTFPNSVTNSSLANLRWDGSNANGVTTATRKTNANGTVGIWVRNNLIFRNFNSGSVNAAGDTWPTTGIYTAYDNGVPITHYVRGASTTFGNNYYGFRSFNRDALKSDLDVNLTTVYNAADNHIFTYTALQASKNYVAADARIDHTNNTYTSANYISPRGYEGVFRTVVALNQAAATGGTANYILLCGTNVKSGIPNVAGFPLRDGVANRDTRYLKVFYINGTNQYYWVTTEIVSSWYLQNYRAGNNAGSYLNSGDSYDWITAGYGDLSYGFNVITH